MYVHFGKYIVLIYYWTMFCGYRGYRCTCTEPTRSRRNFSSQLQAWPLGTGVGNLFKPSTYLNHSPTHWHQQLNCASRRRTSLSLHTLALDLKLDQLFTSVLKIAAVFKLFQLSNLFYYGSKYLKPNVNLG